MAMPSIRIVIIYYYHKPFNLHDTRHTNLILKQLYLSEMDKSANKIVENRILQNEPK